jgi:hypothetical protein
MRLLARVRGGPSISRHRHKEGSGRTCSGPVSYRVCQARRSSGARAPLSADLSMRVILQNPPGCASDGAAQRSSRGSAIHSNGEQSASAADSRPSPLQRGEDQAPWHAHGTPIRALPCSQGNSARTTCVIGRRATASKWKRSCDAWSQRHPSRHCPWSEHTPRFVRFIQPSLTWPQTLRARPPSPEATAPAA